MLIFGRLRTCLSVIFIIFGFTVNTSNVSAEPGISLRKIDSFSPITVDSFAKLTGGRWWEMDFPSISDGTMLSSLEIEVLSTPSSKVRLDVEDEDGNEISTYDNSALVEGNRLITFPAPGKLINLHVTADVMPETFRFSIVSRYEESVPPAIPLSPISDIFPSSSLPPDISNTTSSIALIHFNGVPCTGFLVSKNFMVSNYHCLQFITPAAEGVSSPCSSIGIMFDYSERGGHYARGRCEQIDPSWIDVSKDIFFMRVSYDGFRAGLPLKSSAPPEESKFYAVQHIGGYPLTYSGPCTGKAIAQDAKGNSFRHFCSTAGGSSGSPILDESGSVVAVNRAGAFGPDTTLEEYANYIAKFGRVANLGISASALSSSISSLLPAEED